MNVQVATEVPEEAGETTADPCGDHVPTSENPGPPAAETWTAGASVRAVGWNSNRYASLGTLGSKLPRIVLITSVLSPAWSGTFPRLNVPFWATL